MRFRTWVGGRAGGNLKTMADRRCRADVTVRLGHRVDPRRVQIRARFRGTAWLQPLESVKVRLPAR